MNPLLESKRVWLVGGPGGVGKTTLAASLGLALANQGHRTVVLTVDPAKRLAQALGFKGFQSDLQKIPTEKGELFATMLDTERYFDRIIEKFATSEDQKRKILSNPLYRTMVGNLGGSHEYAAMERLLEFVNNPSFDKIIVDTPPSDNARELFDAPQRLADFMDGSVLSWFQGGEKLYMRFFKTGTRLAMGALKLVFGSAFLDSLGTFLADLDGMQVGFRSRNLEILKVLRSPESGFLLVTVPSESRALDCAEFAATLKEREIPLTRLVLNRLEAEPPASFTPGGPLERIRAYQQTLYQQQNRWAEKTIELVGASTLSPVRIERRDSALHELSTLSELGRLLVS